jgi:hypothetical protein
MSEWQEVQDEEWRGLVSKFLGLESPVSSAVARRAAIDQEYFEELAQAKDSPVFLNALLTESDKPNTGESCCGPADNLTGRDVFHNASLAMLAWAKDGFGKVDQDVFNSRVDACKKCEYSRAAPSSIVYSTIILGSDNLMCGKCGCIISRKARMRTETCPDSHSDNNGLNKWGQSVKIQNSSTS